jgi:N-acetylmuramoyl-L-alanine amidase
MSTVVLDPGHGGAGAGGSSGAGVVGDRGTTERDVVLAVARRAAARLRLAGHDVILTRDDDRAVALADRAAMVRRRAAAAVISLHLDADVDRATQGTSAWVHDAGGTASVELAGALAAEVGAVTGHRVAAVGRAPLAVLDPHAIGAGVAAAHVELAYLSDPREEARLGDPAYLDGLAGAVAGAVARALPAPTAIRRGIDLWNEVPLVPQVTGMSCWAAAAAMLIGWRDAIPVDPEEVARAAGRWQEYRDGLEPRDVGSFAQTWGLQVRPTAGLTAAAIHQLLVDHGPLWIGEASPGLHVIVIAGMIGDGTDAGTELRIVDPWPVGRGERYRLTVGQLAASHAEASRISGAQALVLHAARRPTQR